MALSIDLKRQDVSVREGSRRLLSKSLIYGGGPRSKQRRAEVDYRAKAQIPDDVMFEKFDDQITGAMRNT